MDEVIDEVQTFLQQGKSHYLPQSHGECVLLAVSRDVEVGKVPIEDYIITKVYTGLSIPMHCVIPLSVSQSLTKRPSDYPDKRSLPHVQV